MTIEFHELPVPESLAADHTRRGGHDLKRFVSELHDGVLRCMVAREPAGKRGQLIWHISVTVAANGGIGALATRAPTDNELAECMQLVKGVQLEAAAGNDPRARHLWEVEA